jgi:chaperonin GroES
MAKQNYRPLFDNVLIKPLEAEEKLPSGIILPDSAKEKPQIGQVMAVGPGSTDDKGNPVKMVVKVGLALCTKSGAGMKLR